MGQCHQFKGAAEILYQISKSDADQQSWLRKMYWQKLEESALTAKVPLKQMHHALIKRRSAYAVARIAGKSAEEAFEASAMIQSPSP
jgi:hypothetical protein